MIESLKVKKIVTRYIRGILESLNMGDIPVGVRYSESEESYPYVFIDIGDEMYITGEGNGMLEYDMIFNKEVYLELQIVPVIVSINTVNDEEANSILEKTVDKIRQSYLIVRDEEYGNIVREDLNTQRAIEKTPSSKEPVFVATISMGLKIKQIKTR